MASLCFPSQISELVMPPFFGPCLTFLYVNHAQLHCHVHIMLCVLLESWITIHLGLPLCAKNSVFPAENTELATRAGSPWANGCAFLTCVMSPSSIPNLEITDLLVVPVGFKVQFKAHMPIFPFWNDHGGLRGPLSLHLKLVTWYSHRSICSKQWPC